jgi:hypothetical protein
MAALTLTALLDHAAEQHGENLALIALGGAIEKATVQLQRAGVKPSDLAVGQIRRLRISSSCNK